MLAVTTPGELEGAVRAAIDTTVDLIEEAYMDVYRAGMERFGVPEYERFRPAEKRALPGWLDRLLVRLMQTAGRRVTLVQAETKERLVSVLREPEGAVQTAAREGWGIDKLTRRLWLDLRERFPAYGERHRVERIARTEVIASSNAATVEAARQAAEDFGLTLEKVWIATRDGRTREAHLAMDGQRVGMQDAFTAPDGTLLAYPGDPNAPPSLVINCRCAVAHEPVG